MEDVRAREQRQPLARAKGGQTDRAAAVQPAVARAPLGVRPLGVDDGRVGGGAEDAAARRHRRLNLGEELVDLGAAGGAGGDERVGHLTELALGEFAAEARVGRAEERLGRRAARAAAPRRLHLRRALGAVEVGAVEDPPPPVVQLAADGAVFRLRVRLPRLQARAVEDVRAREQHLRRVGEALVADRARLPRRLAVARALGDDLPLLRRELRVGRRRQPHPLRERERRRRRLAIVVVVGRGGRRRRRRAGAARPAWSEAQIAEHLLLQRDRVPERRLGGVRRIVDREVRRRRRLLRWALHRSNGRRLLPKLRGL